MSSKKTLYIDLGGISYHPDEKITGIPRVTLSLARELSHLKAYDGVDFNLISLLHDGYKVPEDVMGKFGLVGGESDFESGSGTILLLDIYYFKFNFLNKLTPEIRSKYQVVDYIHDILPLTMDGMFQGSAFKFKHLVQQSLRFSDAIITPSRWTADQIVEYILSNPEVQVGESLKLGYSYHGADFSTRPTVPDNIGINVSFNKPYFLMVGTLEIRKNHFFVLEAFEKLWQEGVNVALCMAGRIGWMVEPLVEKLKNHPERNKRLFLFQGPSDAELVRLYKDAYCLIFASKGEGFGLPIIEAAHYGVPLLLSDITIFREIASDNARYFSLESELNLVAAITQFLADDASGKRKEDSANIPQLSWLDSAKNMVDVIQKDNWHCEISHDKSVTYQAS